jgi:cell division protein FtsW (lipid II flippase)
MPLNELILASFLGISDLTWKAQILPIIGLVFTAIFFYFVLPTAALIWAVYVVRRTNRWLDKREARKGTLHEINRRAQ